MSEATSFPIVGIGASAGGIEALEGFFRGLPETKNLAIVIVTHLSPERESRLHEVVGRFTGLPVHVASDGQVAERGHVYVLPADAVLGIDGGRLRLHRPETGRERHPIDLFFASLAKDRGEAAVGVVLSGGDSDGTLGLKAIKEHGGLTFAQVADGYGPQQPSMPDSAISAGVVDFALPADRMGPQLIKFYEGVSALDGKAGAPATGEAEELEAARPELYALLRNQVGHDFAGYKPKTFLRRVLRRMHILGIRQPAAYLERLRQDPPELAALFRDLLIGVTNFFRDAGAFEALATQVIPRLFEGRGAEDSVRVWVPGCSTGEEVYSIAILLREQMEKCAVAPLVQVFATDIDERALAVARGARYPAALLESVTPERRARFLVPEGGSYLVSKEVRALCIFSPHNVIRDPPFSRMDLISCRNLLIYFGPEVQNQVLPVFHYALRPEGYLFLGTAESVGQYGDLFAPLDKKSRIFRRRADGGAGLRLPVHLPGLRHTRTPALPGRKPPLGAVALRQAAETQVLDRYAPAFVVVNRDGDVAHYSARTGRYLEPAAGLPSRQILALARKGLRLDLRTVLRDAVESGRRAVREGIAVEGDDGRLQRITLTVEPLRDDDRADPLYVVLFEDVGPPHSPGEAASAEATASGNAGALERELRETRERLQSMIEEYETALEELKASNEELVSVNEELQSTNEELEASKEEMQSVNEELHTVNAELNGKVEALDRANSDLHNLFESTGVATVFLDASLVIRSFTPAVARVFSILPGDRGRPITDLASRLSLPNLTADITSALADGRPIERRAENYATGEHYLVRISPYRDADGRIQGVVVTFVDVTGLTHAEDAQHVLIRELHHRTRNLLTVVQAIAGLTLGKGGSLQSFTDRLGALGRAQELVSRTGNDELELGDVVRLELGALSTGDRDRITVGGPPVMLGLGKVQAMALALHELATNAMKYGALQQEGARLSVTWSIEPTETGESVVLVWKESGVTMPATAPGRGYGRQLIERSLSLALGTEAKLDFGPDGVHCRIEVPLGLRPARELGTPG